MTKLHRVIRKIRAVEGRRRPDDDYSWLIFDYMERKPVIREPTGEYRHENYLPSLFVGACLVNIPNKFRTVAKDLEFLEWVAVWFSTDPMEE
jgi:hypothetical protein